VQGNWKGLGSYGTLGLEIVLGLLLPCYVGAWADKRWSTGNTFLIIGFVLGIAHGVRAVKRALDQTKREAERAKLDAKEARKRYYDKRK
jgi:F0F1-type ATP synthase assembly protein I